MLVDRSPTYVIDIRLYFFEVQVMTLLEDDLLAALKELLEVSEVMTNGENQTSDDMIRYSRAVEWANRVITLAESETK